MEGWFFFLDIDVYFCKSTQYLRFCDTEDLLLEALIIEL